MNDLDEALANVHPEVLQDLLDLLDKRGFFDKPDFNVKEWNLTYKALHLEHSLDTYKWMLENI